MEHPLAWLLIIIHRLISEPKNGGYLSVLWDRALWKEVRDSLLDRVMNLAYRTMEVPLENLLLILFSNREHQVTLTDGTAEDGKQAPPHSSSLISMIWATSGPVEIRVTGAPISSSAISINARAFSLSLS